MHPIGTSVFSPRGTWIGTKANRFFASGSVKTQPQHSQVGQPRSHPKSDQDKEDKLKGATAIGPGRSTGKGCVSRQTPRRRARLSSAWSSRPPTLCSPWGRVVAHRNRTPQLPDSFAEPVPRAKPEGVFLQESLPFSSGAMGGMVAVPSSCAWTRQARLLLPLRFGAALAMAPWVWGSESKRAKYLGAVTSGLGVWGTSTWLLLVVLGEVI